MKTIKLKFLETNKLYRCALGALVLAAISLVGCEKLDFYSVDSPSDLQHRIDSIEAAKPNTGDTTYLIISNVIVGAEDNSAAWWTSFSDYFTIPSNKLLHLEFVNYGTGVNNWNNWNLCISNVANRDDANYKEYFVIRSDAWGWGGKMVDEGYPFDRNLITHNYHDIDGNGDIWNDFRTTMQGAYVTIEVDHSATGNVFITSTAVGKNDSVLIQKYHQPVSATDDIVAFLIADGSHFEMKKAYLIPSKVTVVEDVKPVSIVIEGAPTFVEFGNNNFWGKAVATVTYADGSSEKVDSADLSFNVIPDMTTLGKKTVVVAYSKTKQGKYGPAVSTFYTLEVTNPVVSLAVTTMPVITTYYYYSNDSIIFDTKGLVVTATYSDNTTAVMENASLKFGKIPAGSGTQNVVISYVGTTKTITTTCPLTLIKGVSQVGNTDFSSAWWTAFSDEFTVPSGSSKTFTMYCYSNNLANWNSPCTILRKADKTEYAVVRMDNFGWGNGYGTATRSSDWNWDIFTSNINGSKIVITVTNNGNNTATVNYDVTYANGEKHFQKYEGITVESSDLNCALVTEHSYLVFIE
jgi:hypothetical protein